MPFRFEELKVYQHALDFVDTVYELVEKFPSHELYALISQLRRAAISIVLNIAEGTGRTKKDFGHAYYKLRTID